MLAALKVPLFMPLLFLGSGAVIVVLNRRFFKDLDRHLRNVAQPGANRLAGATGGGADVERQYRWLRRLRSFLPLLAIAYLGVSIWLLVIALSQL